jgi:hypothetical protein
MNDGWAFALGDQPFKRPPYEADSFRRLIKRKDYHLGRFVWIVHATKMDFENA